MGALLTELVDGVRNTIRDLRTYLLGRGIITTMAIGAGFMSSTFFSAGTVAALSPAVAVIIGGGLILSGVMRVREMMYNQDRMADIYREEIADQLGIAPEQVTRQHVHTLAYGDKQRGIAPNPILREEIDREWNKTWLKFATSALAAMAGYGLIQFGLATNLANALPEAMGAVGTIGNTIGSWLSVASVGIVTGAAGLVLNNGLDIAIQRSTTLGERTLHDRIAKLDRDIDRNRPVSKEQVFALFVASDRMLEHKIATRYGKSYDLLPLDAKTQVIEALGAAPQMQGIANDLNSKRISAGTVAFIITGQRGMEAAPAATVQGVEPITVAPTREVQPMHEQPRFVERVGNPRGDEGLSHTERETLRRAAGELEAAR